MMSTRAAFSLRLSGKEVNIQIHTVVKRIEFLLGDGVRAPVSSCLWARGYRSLLTWVSIASLYRAPFFQVKCESTTLYFLSLLFSGRTPACPKQVKLTTIIISFYIYLISVSYPMVCMTSGSVSSSLYACCTVVMTV